MAKRTRGTPVTLDSFLDIMTCMEGVLMLIIISTGIDAAQTKVLVPTPMEHQTNKRPILVECRGEELFEVPLDELRRRASAELKKIAQDAKGDSAQTLRMMGEARVETESHRVDLTYALLGQLAILPVSSKGYRLDNVAAETAAGWFGRLLNGVNREEEMMLFLVRDDSYVVFKRARSLAWVSGVEASYELLDVDEPIKFGLGGAVPMAQ